MASALPAATSPLAMNIETDIAIIGAGIVGAACACELARGGWRVVLVDRAAPAEGTSGACDGYVSVSTKIPGLSMQLALASREIYPEWAARLGIDAAFHPIGGLLIVEDEANWPKVEEHVRRLGEAGVSARLLDRTDMLKEEPALSPHLAGAVLCDGEAHVAAYRMNLALVADAMEHGAECLWNAPLVEADVAGGEIRSVRTPVGSIRAGQYVIATGVWSEAVGKLLGVTLPVAPRRGDLIVTGRSKLLTPRMLVSARYLTAKAEPEIAEKSDDPLIRLGYGFVMEPTVTGQHIIGSTRIFAGFDRRADTATAAMMMREAARRVPGVAGLEVLRCFAGLRPYVPDKKPLIGRSDAVTNMIVATGHEGDGVTLAPITARIVAALARGDDAPFDLTPLHPDRFNHRPSPHRSP
ncbi:MAG: FAD-binding oxidoreductase [Bauldia sp.]|nr:MAG: FAD-binding oxidoreductase [Bauldia sp.]MBZ0230479.1 FAD-binding oxidoreductase [Bauldia sp.]